MSVAQTRWGAPALHKPAMGRAAPHHQPEPSLAPLRILESPHRSRWRVAKRPRLLMVGGVAVMCLVLLGVVVAHVMLAQSQLRLDKLNRQLASQVGLHRRLELQVAQLESPSRIVTVAQQRMHMVVPGSVTYLVPKTGPAHADNTAGTGTAASPSRR